MQRYEEFCTFQKLNYSQARIIVRYNEVVAATILITSRRGIRTVKDSFSVLLGPVVENDDSTGLRGKQNRHIRRIDIRAGNIVRERHQSTHGMTLRLRGRLDDTAPAGEQRAAYITLRASSLHLLQ